MCPRYPGWTLAFHTETFNSKYCNTMLFVHNALGGWYVYILLVLQMVRQKDYNQQLKVWASLLHNWIHSHTPTVEPKTLFLVIWLEFMT